jgi:group I intron endonuclease
METIVIYGIFHPDKPEIIRYVGKTKKDIKERLRQHIYLSKKNIKRPLYLWIKKMLKENKIPEIKVIEVTNDKEWVEKEIYWIKNYKETNKLLNLTDGGESNLNYVPSEETRKKISKSNKGKHNYWKAKKLSDEHKEKIGKSGKGKKRTQETKKNISNSLIGKKLSKEHKLKLSQNSYLKGKPAKNVRKVKKICLKTKKILEIYPSLEIACKKNNIKNKGNIVLVCKGVRNSCGGFFWEYVNN